MGLMIAQVSQSYDTTLARDRMVNTLWFDKNSPGLLSGTDYDALAQDLCDVYERVTSAAVETTARFYDADDPKPRPIKASKTIHQGASPTYDGPRESCLCLSFYADRNLPKRRGRVYVPVPSFSMGGHGVRPSDSQLAKVLTLADELSDLGGADIDWCVHSPTDQQHYKVTHAWVDDEWDTMRSRGLRATKRVQKDVSG